MTVEVDNNMRKDFFGSQGDTRWNQKTLEESLSNFHHYKLDIRDRKSVLKTREEVKPNCIAHTAAQPSHDFAGGRPFDDFNVNAVGTFNLLEAARQFCPEAPFVI